MGKSIRSHAGDTAKLKFLVFIDIKDHHHNEG